MLLCQFLILNFDKIFPCPGAYETLSQKFLVKKLHKKQLNIEVNLEEYDYIYVKGFNMLFVLAIRGRLKIDPCNR